MNRLSIGKFLIKFTNQLLFVKFNKMSQQLPADCFDQIFECYDESQSMTTFQQMENQRALRSCLLVSRLWCQSSVRILWRNIQNYQTLMDCLPDESKKILRENQIKTSRPPSFHYVDFVKTLSTNQMVNGVRTFLKDHPSVDAFYDETTLVIIREMFKMFLDQTSLKTLDMGYSFY